MAYRKSIEEGYDYAVACLLNSSLRTLTDVSSMIKKFTEFRDLILSAGTYPRG
jgi:hypothetical protein